MSTIPNIVHAKSDDDVTQKKSLFSLTKGIRRFRSSDAPSPNIHGSHLCSSVDYSRKEKYNIKSKNKIVHEEETDSCSSVNSPKINKCTNKTRQNIIHEQVADLTLSIDSLEKKSCKNKKSHKRTYRRKTLVSRRVRSSQKEQETSPKEKEKINAASPELCALLADIPSPDPRDTVLHLAFRKPYSEELIVDHLLKSGNFSEVLMKVNSTQNLPIHIAMQNEKGLSDRVYDTLLDMNPKGVEETNIDGSLPIHLACAAGVPSIYALKLLSKAYPESLQICSKMCYPFQTLSGQYKKDNPSLEELEISESKPRSWWDLFLMSPVPVYSFHDQCDSKESIEVEDETNFTPLHLAVLNHAPPEAIECLIQADIQSLEVRTSKDRTAMNFANFLVADKKLGKDSTNEVINAFAAIELIEISMRTHRKRSKINETVKLTTEALKSIEDNINQVEESILQSTENNTNNVENAPSVDDTITVESVDLRKRSKVKESADNKQDIVPVDPDISLKLSGSEGSFDAKIKWMQIKHAISFVDILLRKSSMLGPTVEMDSHPAVCPLDFRQPPNFDRVTIDLELPVGFRRLRSALLRSKTQFLVKEYLTDKMKNLEVKMEEWDKLDTHIGSIDLPKGIDQEDFVGATRKCQYIMPKSGFVAANRAYETACITEYNEYCFVLEQTTKNPEVPFGNTFEAHRQCIVINRGNYGCRMVSSVSCVFPGKKPMIAWKIKNAMYSGCADADVAFGEVICEHAANT